MRNYHGKKRSKKAREPLTPQSLEEMALSYVARYATSSAKLARYLSRKVYERGWAEEGEPDIAGLVDRFLDRRFVDDEAYARMRSSDLLRRGYGANRVRQALGQAGIGEQVADKVAPGEYAARSSALQMARKRRFGPFAAEPPERDKREKQIAAMLRAGHKFDHVRALLDASNEDAACDWVAEAEGCDDEERG